MSAKLCKSWGRTLQLSRGTSRARFHILDKAPQLTSPPLFSSCSRSYVTWPSLEKNARTSAISSSWSSNSPFYRKTHSGGASLLPDPPGPVRGWPTPLLTREEWLAYSKPFEQRGWHVAQIPSSSGKALDSNVLANSELRITFVFSEVAFEKDSEQLISLFNDLEKEENHHVVQSRDERDRSITLALHTHSAIRPEAYPGEPKKNRKVPGITARDIRYVVLLENLLNRASYSVTRR